MFILEICSSIPRSCQTWKKSWSSDGSSGSLTTEGDVDGDFSDEILNELLKAAVHPELCPGSVFQGSVLQSDPPEALSRVGVPRQRTPERPTRSSVQGRCSKAAYSGATHPELCPGSVFQGSYSGVTHPELCPGSVFQGSYSGATHLEFCPGSVFQGSQLRNDSP